ncbi:MAG: phosphoglycerate kinase [Kosmotogaceae bacterium]
MSKKTIKDVDLKGKKILMRVDFNVPIDKETGEVTDDTRIKAALPTIKYVIEQGGKAILVSHLGRPKGERKPDFSLKPVAKRLERLIGKHITFVEDCIGEAPMKVINAMNDGEIVLLENVRFYAGEKKNDPLFAKELAKLGNIHVNDAFGTAHRAHASNVGVAEHLESVAGFLMQKEIDMLGKAVSNPDHPYVVILGGAKVSDKIGVIENLLDKANKILIGGAMMFTFLKSLGKKVGDSLVEDDKLELAKSLLKKAKENNVKLILPVDTVIAQEMKSGVESKVVSIEDGIPEAWKGLDIGPKTVELFRKELEGAKTVVWNGPMGVFEVDDFAKGTEQIAKTLASMEADTIIGGGDSAAAIAKFGLENEVTHVSTGGGASLAMLEGTELPGIKSIAEKLSSKKNLES